MRPYLIVAPDFQRQSAGVRALHLLCHRLNECGAQAFVSTLNVHPEWDTPCITDLDIPREVVERDWIVVMPEVFPQTGGFRCGVRWVLNSPGKIGGPTRYDDSEMVWVYSRMFLEDAKAATSDTVDDSRILTLAVMDPEMFCPPKDRYAPRDGECVYIGKGTVPQGYDLSDKTVITKTYPSTHIGLARLFRSSRRLISFDDCTGVVDDARACGCPVTIAGAGDASRYDGLPGGMLGMCFESQGNVGERVSAMTVRGFHDAYCAFKGQEKARIEAFIKGTQERFA